MPLDATIAALTRDPPPDHAWPAQTLAQAIASGDLNLNAVLYVANRRLAASSNDGSLFDRHVS